jgi:two-component system sensor histidine kinase KdpD
VLREHDVLVELPDDLPDVPIDVVQIDQVLTNVIENAARFTPTGKRISVSAGAPDGVIQVRVSDEGRGVDPSHRGRIFEPFVRADDSPGTGLGLAIARAIVEAHGGRIWFEDHPGPGAAVLFDLPREP